VNLVNPVDVNALTQAVKATVAHTTARNTIVLLPQNKCCNSVILAIMGQLLVAAVFTIINHHQAKILGRHSLLFFYPFFYKKTDKVPS
jgi:hypothetical protein